MSPTQPRLPSAPLLRASVSLGYARGRLRETAKALPPDRKDWYD